MECAGFVELPPDPPAVGRTWAVAAPDRPTLTWTAADAEVVGGVRCLKLTGTQQTPDWERPAADRPAWSRRETVWLAALSGTVQRLERSIEWRCLHVMSSFSFMCRMKS